MTEPGIIETREIIKTLKETHELDFSNHALTSFRRRLGRVMADNEMKKPEELVRELKAGANFIDLFLKQLSIPETELFRDPSLWRMLRDKIAPVLQKHEQPQVWVPANTTGEELYSLLILLEETELRQKCKVRAEFLSPYHLNQVKQGHITSLKHEININNYQKYNPGGSLENYLDTRKPQKKIAESLLEDIELRHTNYLEGQEQKHDDLVLFRNQMIYYNQTLEERALGIIHNSMSEGGHLAIGVKESLSHTAYKDRFVLEEAKESIYRKKKE